MDQHKILTCYILPGLNLCRFRDFKKNCSSEEHCWQSVTLGLSPSPMAWIVTAPTIVQPIYFTLQQWVSCCSNVFSDHTRRCLWECALSLRCFDDRSLLQTWSVARETVVRSASAVERRSPQVLLYWILLICRRGQWCVNMCSLCLCSAVV